MTKAERDELRKIIREEMKAEQEEAFAALMKKMPPPYPASADATERAKHQPSAKALSSYPVRIGPGEPMALLKPLKNPLFDTLTYDNNTGKQMKFFLKGIGPDKSEHETNMQRGGQLSMPLEFSLLGFNFFIEEGASDEDRAAIINGGLFYFIYCGNRVYADIPLCRMPQREKVPSIEALMQEYKREMARQTTEGNLKGFIGSGELEIENGAQNLKAEREELSPEQVQEFLKWVETERKKEWAKCLDQQTIYPFNIGRSAVRIRPTEAFYALINWKTPPKVSRPIRLMAMLEGLMWTPL